MSLKQCVKCGQMVEEEKAFCPYCSHSFEPERERNASEFEMTSDTDSFTQSFFNRVLSEMDLNISEAPDAPARSASAPRHASRRKLVLLIGAIFVFLFLVVIAIILFLVLR